MPNDNIGTETINAQLSALQAQNQGAVIDGGDDESLYPYVIFQLFENKFAINCKYVVSIEQVSETTELVNASQEFRGISYYKDEPMSVFDLRRMFGLTSNEEYIHNVADIPGHIAEYEAYAQAVLSGAPSEFEQDPRKCRFGKWFYEYRRKVTNIEVRKEMDKIEPPHNEFHRAATAIGDFISKGKPNEAAEYSAKFDGIKNRFIAEMRNLNETLLKNVTELNIILQLTDKKIGLIVDAAESVEEIDEIQDLPPSVVMTNYIKRLGLSKKDKNIIFIVEAAEFNKK